MAKTCCGGNTPKVKVKQTSCCGDTPKHTDVMSTEDKAEAAGASECACSSSSNAKEDCACNKIEAKWVTGYIKTAAGEIPQVATTLDFSDTFGSWKCRWSIGRMDYKVEPGLYAVGTPDEKSPVLVTANYKMTFDRLREQLGGLNLWIVVLDTDGVNVWCAAGKGTFSTEEVVQRVEAVGLKNVVSHRNLILPQLSATGVAAHEVTKQSGFKVIYGTIRAKDIKAFLANNMQATEEMRTVRFTFRDRLVLTPTEFVAALLPMLVYFGVLFILNAIGFGHYGAADLFGMLGAVAVGVFITPTLLPLVPGRAFSFKGGLLGLLWAVGFLFLYGLPAVPVFGWLKAAAYLLLFPAVSSFCAMNFTGSSTYTSLSGVDREMKIAVPTQLFAAAGAILLLLVSDFIQLFGGGLI